MKRVTLLVHECTASPTVVILGFRAGDAPPQEIVVASRLVESIEDVPDPLPTEPGLVFWGQTPPSAPQRWFVQRLGHSDSPTDVVYCPADKTLGAEDINAASAKHYGLVRLPDPEPQP